MSGKKLIIYGVGRYAEYANYVFDHDSPYQIEGYCIESSYSSTHNTIGNYPVFLFEELNSIKPPDEYVLFIAVGNNLVRKRVWENAKAMGYGFVSYISSKAMYWPDLQVGDNCFIGEGSLLQPSVKIGSNSILFSSQLGHHSQVGEHALLSASVLGGNVNIGSLSFLGMNSTIKENCKVGERNFIGMGSIVSKNTPDNAVYSTPGAIKRKLKFEDLLKRMK